MPEEEPGLKLKLLLSDQPKLVKLIEEAEAKKFEHVVVSKSVGFHDDPKIHQQVVDYLKSIGCKTVLTSGELS